MNPYTIILAYDVIQYLLPNNKVSEFRKDDKELALCDQLEDRISYIHKLDDFQIKWYEYKFDLDFDLQIYVDNTTHDKIKSRYAKLP